MAKKIDITLGDQQLTLETGEIARQADAAVLVSMNGTQVLVTVVGKRTGAEKNDFFPLTVHYQERYYAAGRFPGGFNKREGRPSEQETLTARLIDRPLRPLFPESFYHEVQIVATVLSLNPDVSADILAMIGASAALALSGLPFQGPIGGVRVGVQNGLYMLNPSSSMLQSSDLDLVVAGTDDAILMVESEAKELSEEVMLGAILFGHEAIKTIIQGILALVAQHPVTPWTWTPAEKPVELHTHLETLAREGLEKAYDHKDKTTRYEAIAHLKQHVCETLMTAYPELTLTTLDTCFKDLEKTIVRQRILSGEPRLDGRDRTSVRPITIRPGFLERTHGSVLFTRGETQAIVTATLGNDRDAQLLDKPEGEERDRFLLHYNFPPYSVGETGMMGSPKRREIGHGRLARRSLMAVLPDPKTCPYVLRIVSEITESNGSSSMATVCGASLALMDAGIPLKSAVAGVAMGLIKEDDHFAVLTDILGDEDHLGDMDFKVAGTHQGVTALQMDIKIKGITEEILAQALAQAREGRLHILNVMHHALPEPRASLSPYAPRVVSMKIAEDKIRTVIGKGGATIKSLTEGTGVSIDIDDTGLVQLFSPNQEALEQIQQQIKLLVADIEPGQTYQGKVSKIVDFGAFIQLLPGKDGLLHISQICSDRNQKVDDVLQEGQILTVFVAGIDKQGRVKLEWKDKPNMAPSTDSANESTQ